MIHTFLSLFSGLGGIDLGLERAGWTCIGQVENNPYCQTILKRHWPAVPLWGDITSVTAEHIRDTVGRPDLIAGGFPCQPVSQAGKRQAQADPRWLWPHFARLVRDLRPRFVLVENVPGLRHRGLSDVLRDLAACGYDAEWDCLPASAFGANHERDRLWLVGYTREQRPPAPVPHAQRVELRDERQRDEAPEHKHTRTAEPRDNGAQESLADTQSLSERTGLRQSESTEQRWRRSGASGSQGGTGGVADAHGGRQQVLRVEEPAGLEGPRRDLPDGCGPLREQPDAKTPDPAGQRLEERDRLLTRGELAHAAAQASEWWAAEPDMDRVVDGFPGRVDRVRALGNAVVPCIPEFIGRRILALERADQ